MNSPVITKPSRFTINFKNGYLNATLGLTVIVAIMYAFTAVLWAGAKLFGA